MNELASFITVLAVSFVIFMGLCLFVKYLIGK